MDRLLAGLRAVAEPTRLRIVALCAHGEFSVTDLTQILGQSQPRVSRHLKLLVDAGLLERFREGTNAFFRLADRGVGADLAAAVVDLVPPDDELSALDLSRLEQIKEARAAAAAVYFEENAERWDEIRGLHMDNTTVEAAILDMIGTDSVGSMLDLGTGTGRMVELLGTRATRSVGIDYSREMLSVARGHLERSGVKNWQVRQGNLYKLPFVVDSFDFAIMHMVLRYLEDPLDVLREVGRVLRVDARLLLVDFTFHDVDWFKDEQRHRWCGFSDDQIEGWAQLTGFAVSATQVVPGDGLNVGLWLLTRTRDATVTSLTPTKASGGWQ